MLDCQKSLFSLGEDVHYLNCAYMSPFMESVEKAGFKGITDKNTPYNILPVDFFTESDNLRREFSKIINCQNPLRIALQPSVSYGIATITHGLSPKNGKKIVVAGEQFPSNYYPWQVWTKKHNGELCVVSPPDIVNGRGELWNESILESVDQNTAVVAISNVHWTDGTLFNLQAIRKACDDNGALLVIDGTQSVGALPFDVEKIKPDALVCAGYKWLMGPYSMAMSYYGEAFDDFPPIEENWVNRKNSEDFAGLINYNEEYQPGSARFDSGEHSNFILVPMMVEALRQINEWGVAAMSEYSENLFDDSLNRLSGEGYIIESKAYRAPHLVGIRANNVDMAKFSETLAKKNIFVSVRGNAVRVSVSVFNTKEDIDAFVNACLLARK